MSAELLFLKSKSVLFAEDDKVVREQMGAILEMVFQKVYVAKDGEEAYAIYEENRPDVLLVDIMMPKKDGLRLVKQIRQSDYNTPIVILTSFNTQEYLMKAANLSVDGYLIKPIALHHLIEVMGNAAKRSTVDLKIVKIGENLYYNGGTKELVKEGRRICLGSKELEFFELLLQNYTRVLSREEIEHTLWPRDPACESAVKAIVSRVRKKLGEETVVSIRGIGYKINMQSDALGSELVGK